MQIQLYNIKKDKNSTALPNGGAVTLNGTLRAPADIMNPIITIEYGNLPTQNYAYIPDFRRFYWIENITADTNNLYSLHMSVDVLSTFKSFIGTSKQYVLRSSSQFDGRITDTIYPTVNEWYEDITEEYSLIDNDYHYLQWCVGIRGQGATKFYVFNNAGISAFFNYLLSTATSGYTKQALTALGIGNNSEAAVVVDPLQYISSVVALPVKLYDSSDFGEVSIKIGQVTYTAIQCIAIDYTSLYVGAWHWLPPEHPNVERGSYLNSAPYAEYYLYVPGFGRIDLDPSVMAWHGIDVMFDFDPRSGDTQMTIKAGSAGIISRVTATLGVPVEMAQVIAKGTSALTQTANASGVIGQLLSGNIAGAVSSGASAIQTALENRIPSANSIGSTGSFASVAGDKMLFVARFALPVEENNEHLGRPLCASKFINTIPGYIMTANAHISIPTAFDTEIAQIEAYMDGGFFYETTSEDPDIPAGNIIPLSVTNNGTYTAGSGVDGYSPVTVNVPQGVFPTGKINITDTTETDVTDYATAQVISENLKPENIKKNIDILGVVGSFEGGGGGSLPSVISKIDGGSFTPATDTLTRGYKIEHNLGNAPKMFHIWTDDLAEFSAVEQYCLIDASFVNQVVQQTSTSSAKGISHYSRRNVGGNIAGSIGYVTETLYSSWVDGANKIGCDVGSTYYKAGVTYKWLAWV